MVKRIRQMEIWGKKEGNWRFRILKMRKKEGIRKELYLMLHITWVSKVWLFRFQTITGVICHQKQCKISSRIKKVNIHPQENHKEQTSNEPWDPVNSILGTMSVCLEGGGGDSRFTESVDTLLCCDIGLAILIYKQKSQKKKSISVRWTLRWMFPGTYSEGWHVRRSRLQRSWHWRGLRFNGWFRRQFFRGGRDEMRRGLDGRHGGHHRDRERTPWDTQKKTNNNNEWRFHGREYQKDNMTD